MGKKIFVHMGHFHVVYTVRTFVTKMQEKRRKTGKNGDEKNEMKDFMQMI